MSGRPATPLASPFRQTCWILCLEILAAILLFWSASCNWYSGNHSPGGEWIRSASRYTPRRLPLLSKGRRTRSAAVDVTCTSSVATRSKGWQRV